MADLTTKKDAKKTKKEKSVKLKKINGTNEDQWECNEHDNDLAQELMRENMGKLFQCLNLKYWNSLI